MTKKMEFYLKTRQTFNNLKKEILINGKQKPMKEMNFDNILGLFCGLYKYIKRLKEQNAPDDNDAPTQ